MLFFTVCLKISFVIVNLLVYGALKFFILSHLWLRDGYARSSPL